MGYGSAGIHHFDPIARTLIDENVDEAVTEKVLTDLIARLQAEDWDTEYDSLDRFAEHPVVVRAFAANGITTNHDAHGDNPVTGELPKWPRLLVVGEPVTPEQAADIIIRTTCLYLLDGNDLVWSRAVQGAFGLSRNADDHVTSESFRAAYAELDILHLHTLHTSRVTSAWIGGPHGWCDWDGRIGCANYNLGEWPDRDAVLREWEQIAATWPYLDLTAQLLADEGNGPALAQWRILNGRVTEETPGDPITEPVEPSPADFLDRLLPGGERGVTLPRLLAAIARVRTNRATTTGGTH